MDDVDAQTGSGAASPETHFAPAGRAGAQELAAEVAAIVNHPVILAILDSFCGHALILNRHRQILAASPEFQDALAAGGTRDFVGKRPGEAMGCEHAAEGPGGCGTSPACQHCGAVLAILLTQSCMGPVYDECWISMRQKNKRESVEFRAKATPITVSGIELVVFALHDISDQKRRAVLEQSFLHDARNLLSGLLTWSEVLQQEPCEDAASSIKTFALQLRDLFSDHAQLLQAERGELAVVQEPVDLQVLARTLNQSFSHHPSGEGKNLVVRFPTAGSVLVSDPGILARVLSHMVVNALEASEVGATVEVRYEFQLGKHCIAVHNEGAMAEDVVGRIFQRSFSTKDQPGHGLGTYSMRLLAEQYLGGQVTFTTSAERGTTFRLVLPVS
jgi:signal transduction histidine kinase